MMALKWGIVSAGKISNDFTTAVQSIGNNEHEIVAVAARKLEDAKKFASTHKISKAYGSYEELAKDPNVEVVYIGAINTVHLSLAKLMLEHDKHVLVEKPLTLNHKGSAELIKLAKEKKRFLMEALWSRFFPSYEFIMEQLSKGVIGEVYHVNVTFGIHNYTADRVVKKALGGGSLLDIGIYTINIVEMIFGNEKPLKIESIGHLNSDGVDESISAALLFRDGKTATISTHGHVDLLNEANIIGTKGVIKILSPFWAAEKVMVNGKVHEFPFPPTIGHVNYAGSSGLRYEAMEVKRCIRAGKLESDIMSHNDSLLLAQIEDDIRKQIGVKYDVD